MHDSEPDGARILSAASFALLRAPHSPEGKDKLRGLGWDLAPSATPATIAPLFSHTVSSRTALLEVQQGLFPAARYPRHDRRRAGAIV